MNNLRVFIEINWERLRWLDNYTMTMLGNLRAIQGNFIFFARRMWKILFRLCLRSVMRSCPNKFETFFYIYFLDIKIFFWTSSLGIPPNFSIRWRSKIFVFQHKREAYNRIKSTKISFAMHEDDNDEGKKKK